MGNYMSCYQPQTDWAILHCEVIMLGEDFEVEVGGGTPESGLVHFHRCSKRAGHAHMTPVSELTFDLLPWEWRDLDLLEAIHKLARCTVKIKVGYISPDRPEKYFMGQCRGKLMTTSGSGMARIEDEDLLKAPIECPLNNCSIPRPHWTTPVFMVSTAKHVVYDDLEARHTTIEFFDDSSTDRSDVITGHVVGVHSSEKDGDNVHLICVCHDLSLFQKVRPDLLSPPAYPGVPPPTPPTRPPAPLVVVISHPHGCEKHVSFGDWVGYERDPVLSQLHSCKVRDVLRSMEMLDPNFRDRGINSEEGHVSAAQTRRLSALLQQHPEATVLDAVKSGAGDATLCPNDLLTSISYTAATCPGSSGAHVHVLTRLPSGDLNVLIVTSHFRHRKGRRNASGRVFLSGENKQMGVRFMDSLREEKPRKI